MKDDPLSEADLDQDKQQAGDAEGEDATASVEFPVCACVADLLAVLFPDLGSGAAAARDGLRQFTCPGCGRVYLTNAMNDLCLDCQEEGSKRPRRAWQQGDIVR